MGLVHHLAYGFIVAGVQCVADGQYAVFLTEHELGTAVVLVAHFGLHLVELFPGAVAQGLEGEFRMLGGNVLHHVLAAVAAVVVGRSSQFMLHYRVNEHQLVAHGLEGEVLELAAAAVETHEASLFAENAGKLVHDTAVHAAVVVLSGLTGQYHIPLRHLVVAEEVVQSVSVAAFQGSRR